LGPGPTDRRTRDGHREIARRRRPPAGRDGLAREPLGEGPDEEPRQALEQARPVEGRGDAARAAAADKRADLIEDDLTLISAQRMLQRGTETGTEVALGAESLLSLAREKIQSASSSADEDGDARERTKAYAVSGLAVSSVLLRGEEAGGDGASGRDAAASIWAECVLADLDAWRSASSDSSDDPAGRLSEEELVGRVGATSFVDAAIEFDENLRGDGRGGDGGRLAELSFLSVRDRVWRFLGSDDLADVLVAAATIVADSN
ncbi:hypothetical protein THAOC_10873, partial [Thalassiosira oceanica]